MAGQISTIRLSRYDAQPWGFRLQGGMDFGTPLVVQKVNGGSLSEQAGLLAGDALLKVNNVDVYNMRHKDAQDLIVRSGNNFEITIQRGGSVWRPQVTPTGQLPSPNMHGSQMSPVTKTSLAHKPQEVHHIGSGHNNAARPFSSVNGGDGQVKSIVNKQYNTPVGIYSEEAIAETLSAQAEVLAGGVLGVNFKKNEKIYTGANSEVLKMLQEQENDKEPDEPHAPANFFFTASHAVGGAAGVKSHRHGIDDYHPQHQQQQSRAAPPPPHHEDECIGTPLQQNTLAPSAPHRPSLPSEIAPAPILPSFAPQQPQSFPPQAAPISTPSFAPQQPQSFPPQAAPISTPVPVFQPSTPAPAPALAPVPAPISRPVAAPTSGEEAAPKSGSGMSCESCGVTIAGVFVRIKDKNLHAECFKCATCGTNLKNQGYYNFNNKLYCDIHARLAAMNNPPKGTEGYAPVPIKPNTQLSANTISAALNTHSQHNGSNVNTGYGGPKPFNTGPMSPPMRGPQSPSTYPPPTNVQSWDQPKPQPKPQVNPYATLPRTTGQSQAGRFNTFKPGFNTYNRGSGNKGGAYGATSAPKRGRGILNKAVGPGVRVPMCGCCNTQIRGPFITALGRIWCPDHFVCVNGNCRRPLQDIGFVEEKGDLYCEFCFEKFLAPTCSKCSTKIKGDCLNAIGKHYHPECFSCSYCGKHFGNSPFFLEEGEPYCEADWNELFTTKCFACGFPVEAGDRWVEALNHNYHSQCFNCTMCKKNLEGQSFYNKGGRPFCKNHAR